MFFWFRCLILETNQQKHQNYFLLCLDLGECLKAPMTPLYEDPATIEAEMAAQVAIARAEHSAQKEAHSITSHREVTTPERSFDERDRLINQVRAEVEGVAFGYEGKIMHILL